MFLHLMLFLQLLPFFHLSIQHKGNSQTYRDGWASYPSMPLNLAEAGLACLKRRLIPVAVMLSIQLAPFSFLRLQFLFLFPSFQALLFCDFSSQDTSTLVRHFAAHFALLNCLQSQWPLVIWGLNSWFPTASLIYAAGLTLNHHYLWLCIYFQLLPPHPPSVILLV